ncbi:NFACT RNA binding domain-containing protein [Campylobacter sp. MIT 97-5078]|uniref:NFACT RNA binding domain-containing protein n=1 Tax=Campylobacter sp. MIT 97-5078 TaxID=1548153 RepID=UPI000512B642|nr:NFACT RNA binding domain-containing protein [Campylobacter sp. MIT 97-5078]KGI55513.1 ferrous iron transporter A [Campylobacter sp. MIT 97-5078]TQR27661.1 DUF814 domain-containing protein [Campylobacter sp. MIT 97-5078]
MKYQALIQIANYLKAYKKLYAIKRIDDNVFKLDFNKLCLIFDLSRFKSAIYEAKLLEKKYNAPFDFMLQKYFSGAEILSVKVLENNRVLCFHTQIQKAYKNFTNKIYFEFTGKNTNAIITDENDIIIEALRHIEKSYRSVKIGQKLEPLKPFKIEEKVFEIKDFKAYFALAFKEQNQLKINALKENKSKQVLKKIANLKEHLSKLDDENTLEKQARSYEYKAQVLNANLYHLKDYERNFSLKDFEGKELFFELENVPKMEAQRLFKLSKKLKQKAKNIFIEKDSLLEKISFYDNLLTLIMHSNSSVELEILAPKKQANAEKKVKKSDEGVASFYFNECKILIGKNEKANEFLLHSTKKDDMWLHVQNLPSSHAFIISNKQKLSEEVLQFAAKLCVNFSKLNPGTYLVDYTQRKFVKIKQKAFVNYTNFKSLSVLKE